MSYNIIVGRNEDDRKKFGDAGTILLGKHYIKMGQFTSLSNPVYLDVNTSHVILVSGKRGSGKCLSGDSLITLNDGSILPIEQLANNQQKVFGLNDQLKITALEKERFYEREVNKLLKIKLRSGREIKLTPEHPLLTIKGWKPAQELTITSRRATPRKIDVCGKEHMEKHIIKLLAYLLAEGHNKKVVLFANGDQKIVDEFESCLTQFDSKLKLIKEKKDHYRISQPDFKNEVLDILQLKMSGGKFLKGSKINLKKRSIRILLEDMQMFGLLSTKRFIPPQIFKLPKEDIALFLNRLFSCDGSIYKSVKGKKKKKGWEISYGSSSKRLIREVQHLLLRFDILSRVRKKYVKLNGKIFPAYELLVDSAKKKAFIEHIGFYGEKEKKQEKCLPEIEHIINNPNVDTIPKELWETYRPKTSWADIGRSFGYAHPKAMRERIHYAPARQTLLQIAKVDQNSAIELLATSDIFWDEIKSIELLEGKFKVYDITVPEHHNFVANDIIVHNSYSLGSIAEEMVRLPEDVANNLAVLLFDTMGIFWTMKYPNTAQEKQLRQWNLKPEGMNVVVYVPEGYYKTYKEKGIPVDKAFALKTSELTAGDWCNIFNITIQEETGVLIQRVLKDLPANYSINHIIDRVKRDAKAEHKTCDAVENLFITANTWGLFTTQGSNIADLINRGTTTILDLSPYTESYGKWSIKALVIGLISRRLLQQRLLARKLEEVKNIEQEGRLLIDEERQENPLIWLLIDEAHEFLAKEGSTPATDALVQILREGRQPGISLVLATQQPGEIHKDVLTQTDIVISHRLTSKIDLEALNQMMQSYHYNNIQTFMNELPRTRGAALILDDHSERIYPTQIKPKRSSHGALRPIALKIVKELLIEII